MEQTTAAAYGGGYEVLDVPWWAVLLEGIVALIIGLFLLFTPGATTVVLLQVLAIFWIIGGIFSIVGLLINRESWFWKLVSGVLSILAGAVILIYPVLSPFIVLTLFIIFIGVWAIIAGAIKVAWSFKGGGWGMGLLGVLTIILGLLLLVNPMSGILVLPWIFGIFLIAGGIGGIIGGLKMRS
ncbi:HdeD family acid-resistance protein [Methanosarcina sp. KYL-1]|uniref:HdeD family acid-resistance protein n=1 Tax=Methanosarcina sp. KYL-1 TaxID=2602068 RepID=UPI002100863D|nr:DUF308 domain-containing protein [Methanosarcina sp. KYL-1]MCQ1534951.1 HdeD family acid-resistance protein [Methanosarcina sp. KYL-1]